MANVTRKLRRLQLPSFPCRGVFVLPGEFRTSRCIRRFQRWELPVVRGVLWSWAVGCFCPGILPAFQPLFPGVGAVTAATGPLLRVHPPLPVRLRPSWPAF